MWRELCALPGCGQVKADPKADPRPKLRRRRRSSRRAIPVWSKSTTRNSSRLATAATYDAAPELNVTGVVNPDVSRNIPVISLASGRVIEVRAKLGDTVTKGQLLMRVQSADISGAFSDYRQAMADQMLARAQLARSKTASRSRRDCPEGL